MKQYTIRVTKLFARHLKKLKRKHFPVQCVINSLDGIAQNNAKIKHKIKLHQLKYYKPKEFECHPFRLDPKTSRALDNYVIRLKINHKEIIVIAIDIGTHMILKY